MSDTSTNTPPPGMRRRGPAARRTLVIDGVEWLPRDKLSDEVGISRRTGARKFKQVAYIANVAMVPREASLRALVAPDEPQPPKPRSASRRGPYRK